MKTLKHTTAKASCYNTRAYACDELNENNSKVIDTLLENIKNYHVATDFDLTFSTGTQVFWLGDSGFEVVGSDISWSMLKIAKQKAKFKGSKIKSLQGDCSTVHVGGFDAEITIFNAIDHLTRADFKFTTQNIKRNLNPGGLYIFDIFNLDYLKFGNNIAKLTGDWMAISAGNKFRGVQFSTISDSGILAWYSTYVYQNGHSSPTKVSKGYENTLRVYSSTELQDILKESGFTALVQADINDEAFLKETYERILTIAKKV